MRRIGLVLLSGLALSGLVSASKAMAWMFSAAASTNSSSITGAVAYPSASESSVLVLGGLVLVAAFLGFAFRGAWPKNG